MRNTFLWLGALITLGLVPETSQAAPSAVSLPDRPVWPQDHPVLCSPRHNVCVHALRPESPVQPLESWLRDLEQAVERLSWVLGWTPHLTDGSLGGSRAFDVYLRGPEESRPPRKRGKAPKKLRSPPHSPPLVRVYPDFYREVHGPDRSSAFGNVDSTLRPSCYRQALLAEAYARAGIYAVDSLANDAAANATSAYLATVVAPCEVAFLSAVDDYQATPEASITSPALDSGRGALLFPWFIQARHGVEHSVGLLHTLWMLSSQPSQLGRRDNEPDWFDTIDRVQKGRRATLADLLLDFSVARAFMGDRDDGQHLAETRFLGEAGRVRFDWSIPYASLPRRLGPLRPIEPTGASYIWLDLKNLPEGAGLGFRAEWEMPSVFRISLVKVSKDGSMISRADPPSPERGTKVELNVEHLDDAAALVIVACNVGPQIADLAFDPDAMPYMEQRYEISLFAQP